MNRNQFHYYLNRPGLLDDGTLAELDDLVKEFPYFQAARMLYVKNLKNVDNVRFNRQLKLAAACVNNRQMLFGLLNGVKIGRDGSVIPPGHEVPVKRIPESDPGNDRIEIIADEGLLSLADSFSDSANTAAADDDKYNKSIYVRQLERYIPIADLDLLLFDFRVEDSEILNFDFEDKLPEISGSPAELQTEESKPPVSRKQISSKDLIEDFIRKNPKMPRPGETGSFDFDVSQKSLEESDAFMTETLAEIYLKQGYYYRALQAYEKLSLKYPEKSIYFATQIEKIKELITNQ